MRVLFPGDTQTLNPHGGYLKSKERLCGRFPHILSPGTWSLKV